MEKSIRLIIEHFFSIILSLSSRTSPLAVPNGNREKRKKEKNAGNKIELTSAFC